MRILWGASALICGAAWAVGAPALQDGQWEMTSKTVVSGMPISMPAQTISVCLKKEDIAKGDVPTGQPESGQCQTLESKSSGNSYSYKAVCKTEDGTTTISGTMQYTRTSYQGKSLVETNAGGQAMKISSEYSARRIGACVK